MLLAGAAKHVGATAILNSSATAVTVNAVVVRGLDSDREYTAAAGCYWFGAVFADSFSAGRDDAVRVAVAAGGLRAMATSMQRHPTLRVCGQGVYALAHYSASSYAHVTAVIAAGAVDGVLTALTKFGDDLVTVLPHSVDILDRVFVAPLPPSKKLKSTAATIAATTAAAAPSPSGAAAAAASLPPAAPPPPPSTDARLTPSVRPAADALFSAMDRQSTPVPISTLCCRILCRLVQSYPGGAAAVVASPRGAAVLVSAVSHRVESLGMEGRALIRALLLIDAPTTAAVRSALLSAGVEEALGGGAKRVSAKSVEGVGLRNTLSLLGLNAK